MGTTLATIGEGRRFAAPNVVRRALRIFNPRNLSLLATDWRSLSNVLRHHATNGYGLDAETLLDRRFAHVAFFGTRNAGDTLLPTVLRDLFQVAIGGIRWEPLHVHDVVGPRELRRLNSSKAVVIGGGGLFLKDTNPNDLSGWQWPIAPDAIRRLTSAVIVFAVGYNRFRDQDEFSPRFRDSITALVEKSAFFGLRNTGSIRNLGSYLPEHLRHKLTFQPCMTTLLTRIYPEVAAQPVTDDGVIALNCAFDRSELRFGSRQQRLLEELARAMKQLSRHSRIAFFAHTRGDDAMLPVLDAHDVPYEHVKLYDRSSLDVLREYQRTRLTLGMRGHAQMIPFGCGRPILSLISHDKLRWFLDDIDAPEWGLDMSEDFDAGRVVDAVERILGQPDVVGRKIRAAQDMLWNTTVTNMRTIRTALF